MGLLCYISNILKEEMNKYTEVSEGRKALKKAIERIEILEEIEYVNMYKQPVYDVKKANNKEELEKFFK